MRDGYQHLGVPVTEEEIGKIKAKFQIGSGDVPVEYFTRSLGRLVLQGNNTYWHKIATRLPRNLQNHIEGVEVFTKTKESESQLAGYNVVSIPPAATQNVQANSAYKVPSQQFEDNDNDSDYNFPSIQGQSPYDDFLPLYSQCCVLAKSLGSDGNNEMAWWLNNLGTSLSRKIKAKMRIDQHVLSNSKDEEDELDMKDRNYYPSVQGNNPYHDFMQVYRKCSESAKHLEEKDRNFEMTWWLNGLRSSLANKHQSKETNPKGLQSLPKTNAKHVATRTTKVCSPKKNKKQRR